MKTRSSVVESKQNFNTRQIRTTMGPKYAIVAFRESLTCAIYNIQNVDKPRKKVSGATIKVETNDCVRKGTIVSTADQFNKLLPILQKFDVSSFFGVIKKKITDESNLTSVNERRPLKRPTEIQIPRSPKRQRLYGYGRTHHKNSKCRRCLFGRNTDTSSILALRIPATPNNTPTPIDTTVFDVDLPADSPFFECLSPMPPSPCAAVPTSDLASTEDTSPPTTSNAVNNLLCRTTNDAANYFSTTVIKDTGTQHHSDTLLETIRNAHIVLSGGSPLDNVCNYPLSTSSSSDIAYNPPPVSQLIDVTSHPSTSSITYNTFSSESTESHLLPILPPNNTRHVQSTVNKCHNHPLQPPRDIVDVPLPMMSCHVTNHLPPTATKPHTSRPCAKPIASIIDNHNRPSPTSTTVNNPPSNGISNRLPPTTSSDINNRLPPTTSSDISNRLPPTTSSDTRNRLPPTTSSDTRNRLPPTTSSDTSNRLPPTRSSDTSNRLPPTTSTCLPPTSKAIVDTPPLVLSANNSTEFLTATTTERHNPPLQATTLPVSPFNVITNHLPSTTTNFHSNTPQVASDLGQSSHSFVSIKRPRIHISDDDTEPLPKRANPYMTQQRTSKISPWPSNCSRMYGYDHETLLDLIEPVHDIDNEAFLQEISSLEYPSPNKDMSRSYADEGEEDKALSKRLSPIVEPPPTNAESKSILFQVTGQETHYHNSHTLVLPPAPWRHLQLAIHNVNRYQSFTTSLTKTIPQKKPVHTPTENVLPPVYVSSSRDLSIQNSYPGALPEHTHSKVNQITDSVSFSSIIPTQVSYRQSYSQNLLSSSNPIPTSVQSTFSKVCPQPLQHSSNVIPVSSQFTVYRHSQGLEPAKFPFEQAPYQYLNSSVSNETTFEPESSTSTNVHTQKGTKRRNKCRTRSKPQYSITDHRIMKLKAGEIVGRNVTIHHIQDLINQLPEEDVIEDTTKHYVIPQDVLREEIKNSDGCPETFSRKLLCRIFRLEELQGRSVIGSGRFKKSTSVDSRKINAIQNAVYTWFPGSVYIWNLCVHRMNAHIRYINQKLKNIYNPNCLSHSN